MYARVLMDVPRDVLSVWVPSRMAPPAAIY